MRTNWKLKNSMSIEQLQNVLKWLEKDLEHFSQDDEIIQKQIKKNMSPDLQLVFYTRKWIWRTLKFRTAEKCEKNKCTYSLRFTFKKRLSALSLNDFSWDFKDFKISRFKKAFTQGEYLSVKIRWFLNHSFTLG